METAARQWKTTTPAPNWRDFQRLEERYDQVRLEVQEAGHRRAGHPRVHWRIEERVIGCYWRVILQGPSCHGLTPNSRSSIAHMTMRRIIREEAVISTVFRTKNCALEIIEFDEISMNALEIEKVPLFS